MIVGNAGALLRTRPAREALNKPGSAGTSPHGYVVESHFTGLKPRSEQNIGAEYLSTSMRMTSGTTVICVT